MVRHAAKPKKKKGAAQPPAAAAPAVASEDRQFVQQVSKKGEVNALSTAFLRESDAACAERRAQAQEPFGAAPLQPLVCEPSGPPLGLPLRPPVATSGAHEQAAREEAAFAAWLDDVHERFPDPSSLSPFEHNLEVWRQLWRTLERSDVVCIVADVRNPLLHVPIALYEHCTSRLRRRLVIVLSKVDLVSAEHLGSWTDCLYRPKARTAQASSRAEAAAHSIGSGPRGGAGPRASRTRRSRPSHRTGARWAARWAEASTRAAARSRRR